MPLHRTVPPPLLRRTRRRIALNALAVGAAVVVVAGGGFAGLRAMSAPGSSRPTVGPASNASGHSTPSSSAHSTPPPSALSACTSGELRAVGSMEGAAGSREGAVTITNFSDQACTLQGTPTITLLDGNLDPITSGVAFSSSPAGWVANASPQPPGWPVVTLAPGDSASVRIRWGNWCPEGRAAPLWQVRIPGSGTVDVNGFEALGPPPCNGPGQPSTVEVGPFEPNSGA